MTPRTASQFREIREERKALIIETALELFADEGYHNTTISKIAARAGISKGLLYNYFESKEALLSEVLNKSTEEITMYFDPNKDGYLSEEEFEWFIRKIFDVVREKLTFWRFFYQLLMQKEVRGFMLQYNESPVNSLNQIYTGSGLEFMKKMTDMITAYFMRKKDKNPPEYDPVLEMHMFIYTVEGFAMLTAYMDEVDPVYYDKTINRIVELYK
ncbi:MAG TPA: helix-turn-helix domain-containing protein [Bacteroidales bacterium]|nr:helix-turn-helix domain-containing protein [Bacteroidales bacterium]